MDYIILGSDCRHIYGYATSLEEAENCVKKLNYLKNEEVFYEELHKLDSFALPDKLYVTVSETSGSTTPKIRKFSDLDKLHKDFIKACENEEYAITKLFMYQHFVIYTKQNESKEDLHKRILEKYDEFFKKNLKRHLKPLSHERR